MKEDEKNEKIIRGLLKLPPNRRCINCNSLGPQYVCTNFWTFVCTTCSGMHREFTHRVKSISMAKFTIEEVAALKKGGNERAREIYFMDWDPQRHSIPDNSNIERLRTFIKDVYVNKRYAHERTVDKLPRVNSDNLLRVKLGDRDNSYENRGVVSQLAGSQSPPVENAYLHHLNEKSRTYGSNDERSPVSERASRYGHRRSPIHFEVVDDRFRDEHFGNNKISKDRRPLGGGSTVVVSSPNHQKELGKSNFPLVHPVRDILEEDIPTPCIDEPPTVHCGQLVDSSMKIARSFSTPEFNDRNIDLKAENIVSLIDFDVDPKPTDVGTVSSEHHATSTTKESVTQCSTSSIDSNNWASFDSITEGHISESSAFSNPHAPQCVSLLSEAPLSATVPSGRSTNKLEDQSFEHSKTHANTNSIESVLSQLLAPTTVPMTNHYALPIGDSSPATTPVGDESLLASIGGLPTRGDASLSTAITVQSSKQIATSIGGSLDNQEPLVVPTGMPPQAAPQPAQNASGRVASLPVLQEAKSSGSKELPEDLFTTTYSSAPGPVVGWQTGASRGEPFGAQYHSGMPMLTSPHSAKSANPFDTVNAPVFPSMASLHGALANVAAQPGLLRTFSLGTLSSQMMAPQSPPYAAQPPSFVPAAPPSMSVGQQQAPRNLPALGHQRNAGYGVEGAAFSTSNKDQEMAHGYSFPTTPDAFSLRGQNPFG